MTVFSPGERLGAFEILDTLGEGGMGVVYRARDTRLQREVAVKVLLSAVAGDPARLARFAGEARVLAALNHPNIAGIHGLEEAVGVTALVLSEGGWLTEREGPRRITGLRLTFDPSNVVYPPRSLARTILPLSIRLIGA